MLFLQQSIRMLKKAAQQGRSEDLSDARTPLTDFFSILIGYVSRNCVRISSLIPNPPINRSKSPWR
jgi:hypothetical protein